MINDRFNKKRTKLIGALFDNLFLFGNRLSDKAFFILFVVVVVVAPFYWSRM